MAERELRAGGGREVDVVGRVAALPARADGEHGQHAALRLQRHADQRLQAVAPQLRDARGVLEDDRLLVLARSCRRSPRRGAATSITCWKARDRPDEACERVALVTEQRDPAGLDLQDLEDLVEAHAQHRLEVERGADRGHDGVERDQLLVAALDLRGELRRRAREVAETAARRRSRAPSPCCRRARTGRACGSATCASCSPSTSAS